MSSIFGSAKAVQEADNVLILQEKKERGAASSRKYVQVRQGDSDLSDGHFDLIIVWRSCYSGDNISKNLKIIHCNNIMTMSTMLLLLK